MLRDEIKKGKWKEVQNKLLGDNAIVESVDGDCMTICRYQINKPIKLPAHSHQYEQSIYVVLGEMNLMVENQQFNMKSGDIQVIASGVMHSADITGVPFQSIESYYPIRTDLLKK
jgi:quercetin dioxygenase-like cupin family protein